MNRILSILVLGVTLSAVALATDARAAFTVVAKEEASKSFDFDVRCGSVHDASLALPPEAESIRVIRPRVGDVLRDGFGEYELARIESVSTRVDGDHTVVDVKVVGSGRACEQPALPNAWEAEPFEVRAAYEVTRSPRVQFSTEHGGTNPVMQPKSVTADVDAGWKKLRWKNWGEDRAVAKGVFYGVIYYPNGFDGPSAVTRKVPVTITLTDIAQCGKRWMYSHWQTKFGRGVDPKLMAQARIPPSADCVKSHR